MKRGPKKRLHKKDFSALQPANYRKFFSLVGLYGYGVSLKAWDSASRIKAWGELVQEVKIESDLNNRHLAVILDRTNLELNSLFSRKTFEPPFGFVLDFCFIFGKDPLRVYPELIWMRDIWIEDFKVHLEAAQQALDSGQMGVLREALKAMKVGAAAWEKPELEKPMEKLLLVTKADYTELYAKVRWAEKPRNRMRPDYPEEIAERLEQQLEDTMEIRRRPYERSTEEILEAKKG